MTRNSILKHQLKIYLISLKTWICISIFLILTTNLYAQFKVDAELRNRSEFRDGYAKLAAEGSTPAFLVTQRTRINFSFESENLKIKFTPQDVRIWGDDTNITLSGSNGNNASIDLFEGFADFKVSKKAWLAVGRQQLVYDNQSILSNANWNQNGISSDAVLLKLKLNDWNIHLAGSWNTAQQYSSNNFYPTDRYKSIDFLWINRQFNDNFKVSFIHVAAGRTQTDTTNNINFRQTTGVYTSYKNGNFSLWGDVYYQYGKSQPGIKVSAMLLDIEAGYKFKSITPGVGLSYISGNNKTGSSMTTDHLYDPIYRSRHTFNGFMDYYATYPKQTANGGLLDIIGFLELAPSKKVSLRNNLHFFQLAETNPGTPTDKNLGVENDLVAKFKFSDWGLLESGYLFYVPTETLKTIQSVPNGKFSQFVYLQLSITPTLFKNEQKKL
jgi:hypothetical protein